MTLPIFVDIDGTLTDSRTAGGRPIESRLQKVRELIAGPHQVVIWSGGGTAYANTFAAAHGLEGAVCIGKPKFVVDDNPMIGPGGRMVPFSPDAYFGA